MICEKGEIVFRIIFFMLYITWKICFFYLKIKHMSEYVYAVFVFFALMSFYFHVID